jgi:hypothetical protein
MLVRPREGSVMDGSAKDSGSLHPSPTATGSRIADPDVRCPDIEPSAAYDSLCDWFDEQLQILDQRFAGFKTHSSMKSSR